MSGSYGVKLTIPSQMTTTYIYICISQYGYTHILQYCSTHRSGRVSCSVRSGATMWTPPPTALLPPPLPLLTAACLHLAYNTIVYHLQVHTFKLNTRKHIYMYM